MPPPRTRHPASPAWPFREWNWPRPRCRSDAAVRTSTSRSTTQAPGPVGQPVRSCSCSRCADGPATPFPRSEVVRGTAFTACGALAVLTLFQTAITPVAGLSDGPDLTPAPLHWARTTNTTLFGPQTRITRVQQTPQLDSPVLVTYRRYRHGVLMPLHLDFTLTRGGGLMSLTTRFAPDPVLPAPRFGRAEAERRAAQAGGRT
ncbi:hypothetical protein ACIO3O_11655 [Streptomyces sp. NPDC087440]|uniref:hypothetical protein n=1 Tax=Streptomyces sp. NPDC087440 TaxID=3365790 RepID=UPI0037FD3276